MNQTSEAKSSQQLDERRLCESYFDLMERVGSAGKYQRNVMVLFSLIWLTNGILLMSSVFFYLNPSFDCEYFGLLTQDCNASVCSLPESSWSAFVPPSEFSFKSLANQFQPYYCQNQIYLDLAATFTYLGSLIGYVLVSFYSDNWGRKKSLVLSWTVGCLGILLLIFSQSLFIAAAGLFMAAFSGDTATNLVILILTETMEDKLRQKYVVIGLSFFVVGSLLVTILFYWLEDWQLVCIYGLLIHMIAVEVLIIFYVEETPAFVLRKSKEVALRSLNRIGFINKGQKNLVKEEDIQNVKMHQYAERFDDKLVTYADLCRYPSLRLPTICLSILCVATFILYYGPSMIIDTLGYDMYTTNIIINSADLLSSIPTYFYVHTFQRVNSGKWLFAIVSLMAIFSMFIKTDQQATSFNFQVILELLILCIFKFCISMQFSVLILFISESFPGRARGIGDGCVSIAGAVGSSSCPLLLGVLIRMGINPMILFAAMGIIAIGAYSFLKETKGLKIREEIQEIEEEANSLKYKQPAF